MAKLEDLRAHALANPLIDDRIEPNLMKVQLDNGRWMVSLSINR